MAEVLIPGTQRLELENTSTVVLCPTPSNNPNHPLNWSTPRKCLHIGVLSIYTIMMFGTLCCGTPIWNDLNLELGISFENLNYGYAACQASMAFGCCVFVPWALRYGRRPVYIASALIMLASSVWLAEMQTLGDYIGVSIVYGVAGCVNEALFQITISDLFFVHQRGTVTGIYNFNLIVGNYFAPVAGGYIGSSQGWRWFFWWCVILNGLVTVLLIFFLEESKIALPELNGQVVEESTSNEDFNITNTEKQPQIKSEIHIQPAPVYTKDSNRLDRIDTSIPLRTYWQRHAFITTTPGAKPFLGFMYTHITRPFIIFAQFPAVAFTSIQYGWTMTLLVICATTQAVLLPYDPYNFDSIGVGNMAIAPAIGAILGSIFGGPVIDYLIVKVARRRNGIYEPETRLWLYLFPGLVGAAGMWMYGLTISQGMAWIINAVGASLMGFAIGGCSDMAVTYMQDSYQEILGDALVVSVFIRNALATAFIFAVPAWEISTGNYNMFVALGVLTVVIFSLSIPMTIWGRSFRARLANKYAYYISKQI